MSTFGKKLQKLRQSKNLSQQELSDTLNIGRSTLANYEQGKREPNFDTIKKVANYFNVSVDYLFGYNDCCDNSCTCGTRIKEALRIRGMKQSELAKKTGISKSMISEYLHDKYEPKQGNVQLIAEALNIPINYLLGQEDNKNILPNEYYNLNEQGKEMVIEYIQMLSMNEKYSIQRKQK